MSHQQPYLGKYPSQPNYGIINRAIALQPNPVKLEEMPAAHGREESSPWRGLPPLAAASAATPSHRPCVVAVCKGAGPISQPWRLRPAGAQATPTHGRET